MDLVNLSSHLIASGETLLADKSMYPFSLSTLITTTHSFLPLRMSLFIERIRLDNSPEESCLRCCCIPVSWHKRPFQQWTYIFTITTSSTSEICVDKIYNLDPAFWYVWVHMSSHATLFSRRDQTRSALSSRRLSSACSFKDYTGASYKDLIYILKHDIPVLLLLLSRLVVSDLQ